MTSRLIKPGDSNFNMVPAQEVLKFHENDDVDHDVKSHHHTLGIGPNQAAPGNHVHKTPFFHGRIFGTVIQNPATLKAFTTVTDTHDAWAVDLYTVPISGIYRITHTFKWDGTPAGIVTNGFWDTNIGLFTNSRNWINHAFAGGIESWSGYLPKGLGVGVFLIAGPYSTRDDTINRETNHLSIEWVCGL